MPAPRTTYVNELLTNISVGYTNDDVSYVADKLFPVVTVPKESGLYFVRDKENLRAPADARRSEFGRASTVSNTMTTASYSLEEKSLETPISERVMKSYADPFDPKKNATLLVTDKLKIDMEKDLQSSILAVASGANTLDENSYWNTVSNDIAAHMRVAHSFVKKSTGFKANTLVLSQLALDCILKNTAFTDQAKYTMFPDPETLRGLIARYFDVKRVLIADAVENTAKEGQTDALDYIWADNAVLAYVATAPALETPSAGYHLQLDNGRVVDEWYEDGNKCTYVRATDFYDAKIVDANAMYIFTDVA